MNRLSWAVAALLLWLPMQAPLPQPPPQPASPVPATKLQTRWAANGQFIDVGLVDVVER